MLAGVAAIARAGQISAGATVLGRAAGQQNFGPTSVRADVVGRGSPADSGSAAPSSFLKMTQ
jgi:hypothetical protein